MSASKNFHYFLLTAKTQEKQFLKTTKLHILVAQGKCRVTINDNLDLRGFVYDTKKKKKKMHMPKYISTQECTDILYFLLIGKIYEPASPT